MCEKVWNSLPRRTKENYHGVNAALFICLKSLVHLGRCEHKQTHVDQVNSSQLTNVSLGPLQVNQMQEADCKAKGIVYSTLDIAGKYDQNIYSCRMKAGRNGLQADADESGKTKQKCVQQKTTRN